MFEPLRFGSHHPHAFAVAPVELSGFLFDLELLRGMRAAPRNGEPAVLAIEIATLDRAVVRFEIAHVGPVDVAARGIHDDAIRMWPMTLGQDRFQIGAVGIHRQDAPGAEVEEEQAPRIGFASHDTYSCFAAAHRA